MSIIQLNKRLIVQCMAVLSALFLVYHYSEHCEEYYPQKDDGRNLLGTCGSCMCGSAEADGVAPIPATAERLQRTYDINSQSDMIQLLQKWQQRQCKDMWGNAGQNDEIQIVDLGHRVQFQYYQDGEMCEEKYGSEDIMEFAQQTDDYLDSIHWRVQQQEGNTDYFITLERIKYAGSAGFRLALTRNAKEAGVISIEVSTFEARKLDVKVTIQRLRWTGNWTMLDGHEAKGGLEKMQGERIVAMTKKELGECKSKLIFAILDPSNWHYKIERYGKKYLFWRKILDKRIFWEGDD